jgi:hypothetical protein
MEPAAFAVLRTPLVSIVLSAHLHQAALRRREDAKLDSKRITGQRLRV